ncbi:MAG: FMN-binding protein [Chitinispirillaceae bacterium]|nr:FMN-binding protein [Chitinispirillaceae bacterium]
MIDLFKMIIVLTVISGVAALLVAVTNAKTKDRIADQDNRTQQEALKRIMPPGVTITEMKKYQPSSHDSLVYWTGTTGNDTVFAFKVSNRGYSSTISILVCTTAEGVITGMIVLDQHETPGLGAREQETISKRYIWNSLFGAKEQIDPWFSEQFEGISISRAITIEKSMGEWHSLNEEGRRLLREKNGVTAITGSTISTRAVTSALTAKAYAYLKAVKGQIQ